MNDDEILEAIDRRLADVEPRLPPRRVAVADGLVGRATRPGNALRGSMPATAVAVLLVVVAVALALGSRPNGGVGGEASPSDSIPSTVAIASTPSPIVATAMPSPSLPGLEVIRDARYDGDHVLTQRMGWGPCFMSMDAMRIAPDGSARDAAIDRTGIVEGFVSDEGGQFWVGPTAESAARGYGSSILVIDRRQSAWIVVADTFFDSLVGRQLLRAETPKGRITWSLGNSVRAVPCTDG